MTETILAAESGIQVGHHTEAHWFGLTVNTDTVLATAIAAVIVLALAFFLRAKVTSTGVPERRAAVLGSDHGPAAQPDRGRDRHEDRAVRAAAGGHAVRVHPGRQLALGAAGAVHRFQRCDPRAAQAARIRHQLRAGARAVRVHLLPRGRHLAPRRRSATRSSCSRATSR